MKSTLIPVAKTLRTDATDAERALWQCIRAHRLNGLKFKRQEPMGRFVVDFVCHDEKLIIELDGGQHAEQVRADDKRTKFLEARGYRVVRFWNDDVLKNMDGVLETVLRKLSPSPQPLSRQGRGAKGVEVKEAKSESKKLSPSPQPLSRQGRGAKGVEVKEAKSESKKLSPSPQPLSRRGRGAKREKSPLSPRGRGAGGEGAR
jgi:very-short-patch-repair endonuclease